MVSRFKFDSALPRFFFIGALCALMVAMPSPDGCAATGKTILRIHGSNTIGAKLCPDIAKRFLEAQGYGRITQEAGEKANEFFIVARKNGAVHNIEIKAHGSSTGFASLASNQCDIAMASRRIKPKEIDKLKRLGDMASIRNEHILGIDGIAVIVHRKNPIQSLDVNQLLAIFSGDITNWKALGGKDLPIQVYARDRNSGTYDTFKSMVLKKIPLVASTKRYESNADLSDKVSANPAAIGFCGMPYVRQSKALTIRKIWNAPAVAPTTFTAACEEYPLSRRLYLYTLSESKNRLVGAFARFALSNEGQKSVARLGFAKLAMDMEDQVVNTDRFKKQSHKAIYRQETLGGRRINFNFRFVGNELENRSKKDLERFIAYIQQPDEHYYEPLLIGINSRQQTEKLRRTIIETIGAQNFHVPPKAIYLDDVADATGKPLDSLTEAWLRVVDDGA